MKKIQIQIQISLNGYGKIKKKKKNVLLLYRWFSRTKEVMKDQNIILETTLVLQQSVFFFLSSIATKPIFSYEKNDVIIRINSIYTTARIYSIVGICRRGDQSCE